MFSIVFVVLPFSVSIVSCSSKVNELEEIKKQESTVEKAGCKGKDCQVCVLPWGDVLPHGQTLKNVFSKELAGCDEQCDDFTISLECESGTLMRVSNSERTPFKGQAFNSCYKKTCNCNFKGQIIPDGTEKEFFKQSSRICDDKCEGKVLKCLSGKIIDPLSPKSEVDLTQEFSFLGCEQLPCAKCVTPWGAEIDSGKPVDAYKSLALSCHENCASEANKKTFSCYNGKFKEPGIEVYGNKECSLKACQQCTLPCSKTINDGEDSFCYNLGQSPTCGDVKCASNNVRFYCYDSVLKDAAGTVLNPANYSSYTFPSCTATECQRCKTLWKDEYESGSSFPGFKSDIVQCGVDCQTPKNKIQFSCNNGKIEGGSTEEFKYGRCSAVDCKPCKLPCGKEVISGGNDTCYSLAAPKICGDTCLRNAKNFYCVDGVVSDSNKIPSPQTDLDLYKVANCGENGAACVQCKTPDGKLVDDSKKVTFYKNNLVECADSCLNPLNAVTLTCSDGQFGNKILYPEHNFTSCKTKCDGIAKGDRGVGRIEGEGGGAPVNLCRLPWSLAYVTHNTKVVAYSKGSVPKGSSCEPFKKLITCNAYKGLWTGGVVHIYPTCYVEKQYSALNIGAELTTIKLWNYYTRLLPIFFQFHHNQEAEWNYLIT